MLSYLHSGLTTRDNREHAEQKTTLLQIWTEIGDDYYW